MVTKHLKVLFTVSAVMLLSGVPVQASQMDERIESSVKSSYVYKTYLKDDAIKTTSKDGEVTLTGTVNEASHKSLAKETVASLPGVKSVDNQLTVKGKQPAENSDGWLSIQVKTSLLFNRNVNAIDTQVFVTDGIVTLKGEAANQAQKDLAGEYAKDIKGVKGVNNEMTIAAGEMDAKAEPSIGDKIDDASITAQVKLAFLTHHSTSAFKSGVMTKDGVVTLSGSVPNPAAKDMSTKVANDINGVTRVINNMTIASMLK